MDITIERFGRRLTISARLSSSKLLPSGDLAVRLEPDNPAQAEEVVIILKPHERDMIVGRSTQVRQDPKIVVIQLPPAKLVPQPFDCPLCGQRITDGQPCGCGARPLRPHVAGQRCPTCGLSGFGTPQQACAHL